MKSKTFGVLLGLSIGLPMLFVPLLMIIPSFLLALIFVVIETSCIRFTYEKWKKNNGKVSQVDNIEYCPRCESENIKIYREGYDYEKGFLMRMADVKGGGYAAGFNINRARCHCMNCGKDWKTNYDYRFLDK
jgi:Zn finger protein HypA/HybF involved in hydrogenase expression